MATQVMQSPGHLDQFPAFYGTPSLAESASDEMFTMYDTAPLSIQRYVVPVTVLHSADSSRRASLSPQQSRSAPRRDRTPIQHNRRDQPRSGSQSRSEALMTYVADQLHSQQHLLSTGQPSLTVVPSQSAPTTPQLLPGPHSYGPVNAPGPIPFQPTQEYFPDLLTAAQVQQMPNFGFHLDPAYQEYYPLTRNASISVPMSDLNEHDIYMPPGPQHAPEMPGSSVGQLPPFSSFPSALSSSAPGLEIMSSRPKPQCWDHGCNGRQFSTFSNLLRHQREKSGSAMKAICPYCGTEFTRTTARNGHMYGGKCKGRPDEAGSEGSHSAGEQE